MEKQTVIKDGIVIDKGIVLTAENVETNKEVYEKWLQHWMMYPDLWTNRSTLVKDVKHFLNCWEALKPA